MRCCVEPFFEVERVLAEPDAEELRRYFRPEARIRRHCSDENFSVEEFLRANCEYPGRLAELGEAHGGNG